MMEYTSGGGYNASEANQLIWNIKKPNPRPGSAEFHHKKRSVQKFADDLGVVVEYYCSRSEKPVGLVSVPPSKLKTDPGYNDSLDLVGGMLKNRFGDQIQIEVPITIKMSREKSSQTGVNRTRKFVDSLKANFEWRRFRSPVRFILIYDDVITSGSQFVATREFINDNLPRPDRPTMVGLFWAKAVSWVKRDR